jgi:hypothetical protein
MKKLSGKRVVLSGLGGIFLALVLLISYNLKIDESALILATVDHVPEGGLPLLLEHARRVMGAGYGLVPSLMALVIAWGIYRVWDVLKGSRFAGNPLVIFVSAVFAVLNVSGLMVAETDAFFACSSVWAMTGSLLLVLGWALCFYMAAVLLMEAAGRYLAGEAEKPYSRRLFVFEVFLFIMAFWSVWIVSYYPASMDNDVFNQLKSWLISHNDHHPWFTTVLLGVSYEFGKKFISENAGIFLYILIRDILIAFVFAEIVGVMRSRGLPRVLWGGTALFYAVTPVFGAYAKHAFKDTLSMGAYASYILTLYLVIEDISENETPSAGTALWHSGAALLACLTRHNLVYVVLPVEAILVLYVAVKKHGKEALLLLLSIVLLFSWRGALKQLNIASGSPAEALSIPLQQIGRVYRDDREALTDEDLELLAGVFDMEKLAGYDPSVSDPIKSGFRQDVSGRELLPGLVKIWTGFLTRFPVTYYEAAIAQSYGYYSFAPRLPERSGNWNSGMTVFDWIGCNGDFDEQFDFHYTEGTKGLRSTLHEWVKIWDKLPILSLTDVCALYTWLTVILGMYLLIRRKFLWILPVLSVLLVIGTCMASPVNDCFRYFAPAAAAFPVFFCIAKR